MLKPSTSSSYSLLLRTFPMTIEATRIRKHIFTVLVELVASVVLEFPSLSCMIARVGRCLPQSASTSAHLCYVWRQRIGTVLRKSLRTCSLVLLQHPASNLNRLLELRRWNQTQYSMPIWNTKEQCDILGLAKSARAKSSFARKSCYISGASRLKYQT